LDENAHNIAFSGTDVSGFQIYNMDLDRNNRMWWCDNKKMWSI